MSKETYYNQPGIRMFNRLQLSGKLVRYPNNMSSQVIQANKTALLGLYETSEFTILRDWRLR